MTYTATTVKNPKELSKCIFARAVLHSSGIYGNVIVDSQARPCVEESRYQQEIDAFMKLSHSSFSSIETEDYNDDPIW